MTNQQKITKVTKVIIKVSDLNRSARFYEEVIGLKVRKREEDQVYLSPDGVSDLIVLQQPDNPEAPPSGSTGLYHIAILLPSRASLADQWIHLERHRQWLVGASDHSVSEAIYLQDPDGNGIEIYADRKDVSVNSMGTERLQVEDLLRHATGTPWMGMPEETVMGHIHLKVRDLEEAIGFYRDLLGFDVMMQMGGSAAFLSTGGYHHHIGLNTWESRGGSIPSKNAVGLDTAIVSLPNRETLEAIQRQLKEADGRKIDHHDSLVIKDPSGNQLKFIVQV